MATSPFDKIANMRQELLDHRKAKALAEDRSTSHDPNEEYSAEISKRQAGSSTTEDIKRLRLQLINSQKDNIFEEYKTTHSPVQYQSRPDMNDTEMQKIRRRQQTEEGRQGAREGIKRLCQNLTRTR